LQVMRLRLEFVEWDSERGGEEWTLSAAVLHAIPSSQMLK